MRTWSILCAGALITALALSGCGRGSSSSSVPTPASLSGRLTVLTPGSGETAGFPLPIPLHLPSEQASAEEQASAGERPSAEFVPGEILIKYNEDSHPVSGKFLAPGGEFEVIRSTSLGDGTLRLVRIADPASGSRGDLMKETLMKIAELSSNPRVEYAQPNYIYKPLFVPSDELYPYQWNYPLIKLDHVWDENLVNDVSSITVAVVDTGLARSGPSKTNSNHPDLGITGDNIIDEYDFISDPESSLDGDSIDDDATDPGDDPDGQTSTFHGIHVAGIVGALTHNQEDGAGIGVAGVAGGKNSGARIMVLRALGAGGGTTSDIIEAVKYAAGLENSSESIPRKADIINLSLGSPANDPALEEAVNEAYAEDVLLVAAAGNDGNDTAYYPATYENVISVSAVDIGAEAADYSNYGTGVDLTAPGGSFSYDLNLDGYLDGILSTLVEQEGPDGPYTFNYGYYQGTSMATPHIAGAAALVKQALKAAGKNSSPAKIMDILYSTAIDLGEPGRDDLYGYGLVNVYGAVMEALGEDQGPVLFPEPKKLILEGPNPEGGVLLKNIGGQGPINITDITAESGEAWLSVSPLSGTADESGMEITISVDTDAHPEIMNGSIHTEQLTVRSDGGTETIYVLYSGTGITDEPQNVGTVYAVAVDPDLYEVIGLALTGYDEEYEYTIEDLQPGSYIIGASTDRDGDDIIFEPGEAYGFYPEADSPGILEVGWDDLVGIDFAIMDAPL